MNLGDSFFNPQFDAVSEESESLSLCENEPLVSEVNEEEEFIINEVSTILSEIDVVDPEVVEQESQIQMDFELPFTKEKTEDSIHFNYDESITVE